MRQALIAFASSRLALIVTGYLALTWFPAHRVESWMGLSFPANFFPLYSWVSWIVSLPFRVFSDLEHAFFIGALIVGSRLENTRARHSPAVEQH